MLPATYNLTIQQGATFALVFLWTAGSAIGTPLPVDLTGFTAAMQFKAFPLAANVLFDCAPYLTLGGPAGTISLAIPAASTLTFIWWTAVYDLLITDPSGNTTPLFSGYVNVVPGVTP